MIMCESCGAELIKTSNYDYSKKWICMNCNREYYFKEDFGG